jgi:glucose/arabinose dehydrogenase
MWMNKARLLATVGLVMAAALPLRAAAGSIVVDTVLVASGLTQPLFATSPVAGGPLYVAQKGGTIKAVVDGVATDFLHISVSTGGERGLLGLAFDPEYSTLGAPGYGRFFVNYIDPTTQQTVIASYRTGGNALAADPATRVEVMRIDQPAGLSNHKAGWIGFKPGDSDHLYVATGDGGSSNDPFNHGQRLDTLLGKMLRVDINGDDFADPNINYAIPSDNPFVGTAGARGEIFAYGLRNPFRNSFDMANGNLWIADVGQNAREEVDFIDAASPGGQNFGWRIREGDIPTPGISDPPVDGMIDPILVYGRSFGASITGGYVVREEGMPLYGMYVFGDFISGRVWAISGDGSPTTIGQAIELTAMLDAGGGGALGNISSFGQGADGELYIVDYSGFVVRVVPEPSTWALFAGGGLLLMQLARRRRFS